MNETTNEKPSPVSHLDTGRAGFIAVLLAVVILITLTAIKGTGSSTTTTTTSSTSTTTTLPRNQVKVQVANGSGIAGIAAQVTDQLQTLGWNTLPKENASSSTVILKTTIYYAPNREWAAREIATTLKVPTSAVARLRATTPAAGASGDDVVVILGTNFKAS